MELFAFTEDRAKAALEELERGGYQSCTMRPCGSGWIVYAEDRDRPARES